MPSVRLRHLPLAAALLAATFGVSNFQRAEAYPAFAKKEKKACAYCHLNPRGGKGWGFRGLYYDGHKRSFNGFKEEIEAQKAGVKPNSMGLDAKPTKPYTGKAEAPQSPG